MAARNRPRAIKDDDAHEERNMWNQILNDLKRCRNINSKAAEITAQIRDAEEKAKSENGGTFVIFSALVYDRDIHLLVAFALRLGY
jgi:hypothetical protein